MKWVISFCLLLLSTNFSMSQSLVIDDETFMVPLVEKGALTTVSMEVGFIQYDKKNQPISMDQETEKLGTGFIINDSLQVGDIIVTNDHIYTRFLFIRKNKPMAALFMGYNRIGGKSYVKIDWVKSDPASDIALFKSASVSFSNQKVISESVQKYISLNLFLDDSLIIPGKYVTSIGYPLNIGIELDSNKPVARLGIVAQGVSGNGTFIIDGINSHGNSGSPIYTHKHGEYPFLVGMIASSHNDYVVDSVNNPIWVNNTVTKKDVRVFYNSGLISCIPASKIKEIILNLR